MADKEESDTSRFGWSGGLLVIDPKTGKPITVEQYRERYGVNEQQRKQDEEDAEPSAEEIALAEEWVENPPPDMTPEDEAWMLKVLGLGEPRRDEE